MPFPSPYGAVRGPLITLGRRGTPLDWSAWADLCRRRLGRVPQPGIALTRQEWAKLGYTQAGQSKELRP